MALWTFLSSALLIKPALKLSELVIDGDKDWRGNGITNLKQVTAGMDEGDMAFKGINVMERSSPGSIGTVLTTHDFGNDPTWTYPP